MRLDEIGQNYFTGFKAPTIDENLLSEDSDYVDGPDYVNNPYSDSLLSEPDRYSVNQMLKE
jgi:hypothetical protein